PARVARCGRRRHHQRLHHQIDLDAAAAPHSEQRPRSLTRVVIHAILLLLEQIPANRGWTHKNSASRMASSPTSIESQIDSFLEQFKRSASRAMEEHHRGPGFFHHQQQHLHLQHHHPVHHIPASISRSHSGNFDVCEALEA
ncbi:hypothetical protein QAD02_001930, partial [Eretmocerus hayati]